MASFRAPTQTVLTDHLATAVVAAATGLDASRLVVMLDRNIADLPQVIAMAAALEAKWPGQVTRYTLDAREPDVDDVDRHVDGLRPLQPDLVVGIGGGSCIDLAKAVSVLIYNEGQAAEYQGWGLVRRAGAARIMVPTTAGTGAEVTPGAVVVNRRTGRKGAIGSPYIFPNVAILDPTLTLSLPAAVTASTGMDAMAHAVESFVGLAHNPFATNYAKAAFGRIANHLPAILSDPANLDSRREVLVASTMAGYAIYNLDTGACHAMAYPLGTYFDVPHSLAVTHLLPHVIEHNVAGGCVRYAELYDEIEGADHDLPAPQKARALQRFVAELASRTPQRRLDAFGIGTGDVDFLSEKGLLLKTALTNNPVPFKQADAARILSALVES